MYLHHLQGVSCYIIVNLLLLLVLFTYCAFVGLNKKLYKMHGTYIKKVSSLLQQAYRLCKNVPLSSTKHDFTLGHENKF